MVKLTEKVFRLKFPEYVTCTTVSFGTCGWCGQGEYTAIDTETARNEKGEEYTFHFHPFFGECGSCGGC